MTPQLTALIDPHSAAAEAFQSLRTSLEFSRLGHDVVTLLLAAVDGTPDKSSAVANLAVVMAQAGDRVILVDGDLRRPQQHEIFGSIQPARTIHVAAVRAAIRRCKARTSTDCRSWLRVPWPAIPWPC